LRRFIYLMRGAPPHLWNSFLTYTTDVESKLFLYSRDMLSLLPLPSSIPWPAKWVLVNFSKKYRLCSHKAPDVTAFSRNLAQQYEKLRSTILASRTLKGSWPLLSSWYSTFRRRAVSAACWLARSKTFSHNQFGLLKLGLSQLRSLPFIIVPNDKAAGYTFVPVDVYKSVEMATLKAPLYQPVAWEYTSLRSLRLQYKSLASRASKIVDSTSCFMKIQSTLESGILPAFLGLSAKTHKPQGEVTMRCIHKGIAPCFLGLSKWVASQLEPLADRPWIVKDTSTFVDRCRGMSVTSNSRMSTFDLKDFFLSGTPNHIATTISSAFDDVGLKAVMHDALFFLLDNQFVITQCADSMYKCTRGSGIGLLHSALVASVLFILDVEIPLFSRCSLQRRGVQLYARYHDDIYTIASSIGHVKQLYKSIKRESDVFTIVCSAVGSHFTSVQYLDVTVSFSGSSVVAMPTLEKTVTPLCVTSAHPPHVHRSWPNALVHRVLSTSTFRNGDSQDRLISRYKQANAHPLVVSRLSSSNPFSPSSSNPNSSTSNSRDRPDKFACVLAYHPVFRAAAASSIISCPWPIQEIRFLLSWKNMLPSFSSSITSANSQVALNELRRQLGSGTEAGMLFLSSFAGTCNMSSVYHLRGKSNMIPSLSFNKLLEHQH
jgi:hypothetical protein